MPRYRDRIAIYFRQRPGRWVSAATLMRLGGAFAWRTRVSECRRELGMVITNRTRRPKGRPVISEYLWRRG